MTIHLINPNSSEAVTAAVDAAIHPLRAATTFDIRCHTLADGPPGIETQAHVDGIVGPLLTRAGQLEAEASAFVIACFPIRAFLPCASRARFRCWASQRRPF